MGESVSVLCTHVSYNYLRYVGKKRAYLSKSLSHRVTRVSGLR